MDLEIVYAIHTFEATNEDEVPFQYGEPIIVIEKDDIYGDGWWQGQNVKGQIGLFPMNYTSNMSPLENSNNDGPGPIPSSYNNFNNSIAMLTSNSDLNIIPSEYRTPSPSVDETINDVQDRLNNMTVKDQEISKSNLHSRNTSINGVSNSGKHFKPSSSISSASSYMSSLKNDQISHHKFENTIDARQFATSPPPSFANFNNTNTDINNSNPLNWSLDQVCVWLRQHGFEAVINNFIENDITGDVLLNLTAENLKELNIPSFGKRVHIMNAINKLKVQYGIDNDKDNVSEGNEKNIQNSNNENGNVNDNSKRDYNRDSNTDPSISTTNDNMSDSKEPAQTSTPNTPNSTSSTNNSRIKKSHEGGKDEISNVQRPPLAKKGSKIFSRFNRASRSDKFGKSKKDKLRTNSTGGWNFLTEEENSSMKETSENSKYSQQILSDPGKGKSTRLFPTRKSRKTAIMDRNSLVGSQIGLPKYTNTDEEDNPIDNKKLESFYEHTIDKIEEEENDESLSSNEVPDYKGMLKVQGEKSKSSWKSRFCMLKGSSFYVFGNTKGLRTPKVKGHINLTGYRVISDSNLLQGNYGFKLVHDTERQYCFAHDDREKFRGWFNAMMKATIARDTKGTHTGEKDDASAQYSLTFLEVISRNSTNCNCIHLSSILITMVVMKH
ncbi:15889_t:CDS:10 [Entrophospora sp. SA101]|nr:15889_t:CDS:10 [Entrophospora sp. SA101]